MNVSISALVEDLNTTVSGIQAAISIYALVMAAFILIGGKLADIVGKKRIFIIGLIIYGFMIVKTEKMLKPNLIPQLQDELNNLNYENAKNLCAADPCIMTNILNAGLERISDGILDVPSMEKAMEEASVQEVTVGLRPISYLSIIAQIAPMLGLFGTVLGMIKAFQKISLGGMGNAELLAGNIGEAMVTTATGLVVAIPTMLFYFYLKTRFMANVSQLSRILGNLTHHLVTASRRAASN